MGQETMGKKDREKKKKQKQQNKQEKKEERKSNNNKGKSLDDMLAYIDENGNLSNKPPDPKKMKQMNVEDIQLGAAKHEPVDPAEQFRTGVVKFFNHDKGYGFINDLQSQESVFVHANELSEPIAEQDKVSFEVEKGPKGLMAVRVKKIA